MSEHERLYGEPIVHTVGELHGDDLTIDLTPKITVIDGIVAEVDTYFNWNNCAVGGSTFSAEGGRYFAFHMDPEHGGGGRCEIPWARLEELTEAAPHTIPLTILGMESKILEEMLEATGLSARVLYQRRRTA